MDTPERDVFRINKKSLQSSLGVTQWIGATDAGHEGNWTWTDGSPVKEGNWWPGEPNNNGGQQNCAIINYREGGKWDDIGWWIPNTFHCTMGQRGVNLRQNL